MVPDKLHRAKGSLLGLAAGDALGTTLEFKRPGTFNPISNIVGGGPFGLNPGEWTDDTSMALCLAESLIERGAFDPVDQLQRYTRWWRQGHLNSNGRCFDIGNATRAALARFERTGEAFCGSTDPYSAGNGSLMRLAPVALFYADRPLEAVLRAADSSRTTHAAEECVDACRYMAGLLVGALRGESQDVCWARCLNPLPGSGINIHLYQQLKRLHPAPSGRSNPQRFRVPVMSFALLEATLWAFHQSHNFEEAVLRAVNLGDDADTTGAICGQIAGAYYAVEDIPERWRSVIRHRDLIENFAETLIRE